MLVSDKNGNVGNSIVVGGFFLSGSFAISGKITKEVRIVLHSSMKITHKIGNYKILSFYAHFIYIQVYKKKNIQPWPKL